MQIFYEYLFKKYEMGYKMMDLGLKLVQKYDFSLKNCNEFCVFQKKAVILWRISTITNSKSKILCHYNVE